MQITKRIFSTLALVVLTVIAIRISWLFAIVVTTLIALALNEFFKMVETKGVKVFRYFGILIGIVIPISIFFKFELTKSWELLFITLAFICLFLLQLSRKEATTSVVSLSVTLFGILYVSWLFSFMIKLYFLPHGPALVGMLILTVKAGDIGAYLVGSRFGRHALILRISPKKTVEGALAGLGFNIVFCLLSKLMLPMFSFWHLAFLAVFIGVLSLFGDLSESLIKRDCGIKDASSALPGLGGVLDVIDSLIFTTPAIYFYMSVMFK
ncbi:MAG: phosphatidate cytidylyltransferase [Candidatus Omnitrophica bacterium]|nr:phosphatidate cytidylyltransferase [Candidatus Omnitrophota bacterium]